MGYKQLLPHNRGFEEGATVSWDDFTIYDVKNGTYGLSTDDGCGSLRSGWIRASAHTLAAFDVTEMVRTNEVIAVPGGRYRASVCHKNITACQTSSPLTNISIPFW